MNTFSRVPGERVTRRVFQLILASFLVVLAVLPVRSALAQVSPPTFTKTFTPDTIGPGGVSTLTFNITNIAGVPVTALAFTDVLPTAPGDVDIATPANATMSNCNAGGAVPTLSAPDGGGTIAFSDGAVGPGETCTITVDVIASTAGTHTNITGDLTSSAGNSGTATDDLTVSIDRPAFSKVFSPDAVSLGGRSTLTFTIDNSLNASALSSLVFTDNFPVGMEVANPANASHTCGGPNPQLTAVTGSNSVSFQSFGILFPGFEVLLAGATCTVTVDVVSTATGALNNVTSDLTSNAGSSGKASDTLTVTGSSLLITKEFTDDPVVPGNPVTLEFIIQNGSRTDSATDVAFTDDLTTVLAGLTYSSLVSNDCGGSVSGVGGTTIGLSGGTIAPGGSCTVRTSLSVPAGAATNSYDNTTSTVTANVGGNPVVGNQATDTLFVNGTAPVLTKEFTDDPVGPGNAVTLEFTITNPGTSALTDIAFDDVLSDALAWLSVASVPANGSACGAGSIFTFTNFNPPPPADAINSFSFTGGDLAAGASCIFTIGLTVPAGAAAGNYLNTTTPITATSGGSAVTGLPASDTLVVVSSALTFLKEFTDDPASPGGTATLEFTISNPAENGTATNITFTDDLDAALTGLTATVPPTPDPPCGPGSSLTGSSDLTFADGTLAPGASCTFSVTTNIPAGTVPGTYTNTADNLTTVVNGVTATTPGAVADLVVNGGFVFTKEFIDDPVIPGENVTLRFTLDNSAGGLDATNISFTDDLSFVLPGVPDLTIVTGLPLAACGGTLSTLGGTFLSYNGGSVTAGSPACTVDVTLGVPDGAPPGSHVNTTGNLTATMGGSVAILPPATDALVIDPQLINLTKTFTDDPVNPGSPVTLEFTLENTSASTVTNLAFSDDLAAVLPGTPDLSATAATVNTCGGMGSGFPTSNFSYSGGTLTAGATCTITLTVDVPAGAAPGDYTNTTSTVSGLIGALLVFGDAASDDLTILNASAPTFTKSFDGPSVPGGTPTLTFNIVNNDTVNALTGLGFTDDLDAVITGLVATGISFNTSDCTVTGTSLLTLTGGTLAPSASCTIVVDLAVPGTAAAGTYPNTTSDLVSNGLPVAGPATADLVIEPPPTFAKVFAPNPILFGGVSTLTFTIDNSASALSASALDFTDNLPAGVTVATPANASTTCTGGTVTAVNGSGVISYTGGTVGAGAVCTVQADVTSMTAGAHVNTTGDLTSSSGNSGSATDTLTVGDPMADLSIALADSPDPAVSGGALAYTATITNNGPQDATNVVMTVTLPAGVTFVSTSGCAEDPNGVPTCSVGSIASGANVAVTIDVTVDAGTTGVITAQATVTADQADPDVANNSVSEDTTVNTPAADISVTLVDDVDPVVTGNPVEYTATVTNNGPQDATNVVATVTLPAGVTFVSTSGCAEDPNGVPTCSLGTIANGGNAVFTININVDAGTVGVIQHQVDVVSDLGDPDPGNNSVVEDTTVDFPPGTITIVKNTAPVAAGDGTFEFSSADPDFDAISLTTVSNTATSAAIAKPAGVYTVSEDITTGWVLDAIACTGDTDAGTVIDLPNRSVDIDIDNGEAIVCTFTNIRDANEVIRQTQESIMEFMEHRADQMTANQPDLAMRLKERGTPGVAPLEFTGSGTLASSNSKFSTSLHKIKTWHSSQHGANDYDTPTFDVWMNGLFSHTNTTSSKSHLGMLHLGADYLINPNLVVGGIVQLDWAEWDSSATVATVDGFGWMAGPYFVANPWQNIYIDGRVHYGQSYNDVNPIGTYTDQFDTDRFLASLQVTGSMSMGNLNVNPAAELLYFHERQKSYIDTLGNTIPSQTLELGRVIFGPQFSYNMVLEDGGTLTPSAKFEGIWDFRSKTSTTPTGSAETIGGLRGRADVGLAYTSPGGTSVRASGFYDGIGRSGFEAYGGQLEINVPLQRKE